MNSKWKELTTVILITSCDEPSSVAKSECILSDLMSVDLCDQSICGGDMIADIDLFMAAASDVRPSELIRALSLITWEFPHSVQLLIKRQQDTCFTIYQPDPSE